MKKILCVAPYEGLNVLFQQVSQQQLARTSRIQPHFDFLRFDRQDNASAIAAALQTHYDLIISRGGTATLIKEMTPTPVIDIGVSQYDLLSTIQSASRLNQVAIVAFNAFSTRVAAVIERFHLNTPVFSISNETELPDLLRTLSSRGIDTLICDTTTEAQAKLAGFTTLLITASQESVSAAMTNGIHFLEQMEHQRKTAVALIATLDDLNVPTVVTTEQLLPVLISPVLQSDDALQKSTLRAIKQDRHRFSHDKVNYKLKKHPHDNLLVYTLQKAQTVQHTQHARDVTLVPDTNLKRAFDAYFQLTQSPAFFNLLQSYARLSRPILIVGEFGTGKNYIADQLRTIGLQAEHPLYHLDLGEPGIVTRLINDDNSPLYETEQCFIFEGLNRADTQTQQSLVEFTIQTQLASRNQVIFTFTQSPDDGMSPEVKPLLDYARMLTLDTFNQVTGDKVIQLLTGIINDYNREHGTSIIGVSDIALDFILNEPWDGNFEQFYRAMNLAIACTRQDYVGIDEIRIGITEEQKNRFMRSHHPTGTTATPLTGQSLATMVKEIVVRTLAANHNNRTKTAKSLGISRATLWRYLKQD